ncbi:MAG: nucleoside triphosphate pyrophosphohydrolase [Alphaproteobacteria bacterium]
MNRPVDPDPVHPQTGTAPMAEGPVPPEDLRTADALLAIMGHLRHPDYGCQWDREQTYASIAHYTVEEAFEVDDAIRQGDIPGLRDELGDLLLQVAFHSTIAQERGDFTFADVAEAICTKMIRRHPHVFGSAEQRAAGVQHGAWETQKAEERAAAAARRGATASGVLDDVPLALPALMRAQKLQKRVARVGFDWEHTDGVLDKIVEEAGELTEAVILGQSKERIAEEFGDLLFTVVCLARHFDLDAEETLRAANAKFERRFRAMEHQARAEGAPLAEGTDGDRLDALWQAAKAGEKAV